MTVTVIEQLDVRCCASVAVQVTVVAPTENTDLFSGLHVVVIGDVPPLTVAKPYSTAMGVARAEVSDNEAGHVMLGGATGVGVGVGVVVDELEQLPISSAVVSSPLRWMARR